MATAGVGNEQDFVKELVAANPIMVFSKTYCPYCKKAKNALSKIGASFKVLELDNESNGATIQDTLLAMTGQRTVPNVFVGGKSIGGGTETEQLQRSGELVNMARAAGALA
ncbi:unnamed protein product [Choristocarpus tenellus]